MVIQINLVLIPSVKYDFDRDVSNLHEADYLHFFQVLAFSLQYYLSSTHEDESDFEHIAGVMNDKIAVLILKRINMYREEKVF